MNYLLCYPDRNLNQLISACVRYEATHKKLPTPASFIPAVCALENKKEYYTLENCKLFCKKNNLILEKVDHRKDTQSSRRPPGKQIPRSRTSTYTCWHCGRYGHAHYECRGTEKNFRYRPERSPNLAHLRIDDGDGSTGDPYQYDDESNM